MADHHDIHCQWHYVNEHGHLPCNCSYRERLPCGHSDYALSRLGHCRACDLEAAEKEASDG